MELADMIKNGLKEAFSENPKGRKDTKKEQIKALMENDKTIDWATIVLC